MTTEKLEHCVGIQDLGNIKSYWKNDQIEMKRHRSNEIRRMKDKAGNKEGW